MATLLFGIAGNAIAPGIGGFLGASLGGLLDAFLIMPGLFPSPRITGPRLDDRSLQLASEGSDMKWIIGPRNRTAGTVIWKSPIIEEAVESEVGGKGSGGQKTTNYQYFVDIAIAIQDTSNLPGNKISRILRIWADSKVIYDGTTSPKVESLTIYKGDQTAPDPLMEAAEGVGNVPIYLNQAYIVFKKLALADFGNRIPNMTFEVEQSADVSLGDAIGYICERWSLDPSEYDTSRVSSCFRGMVVNGPQSGIEVLQPLLLGYAVGAQEVEGKIVFFQRGSENIIDVDPDDLAAHEGGKRMPAALDFTDASDYEVPVEVDVTFTSTDNNLQQGSERAVRQDKSGNNVLMMDLPITLTPSEGKAIANRALWTAEAERQKVRLQLPPSYIGVQEGDILRVVKNSRTYLIFVNELTRGANYLIEVQGLLTVPEAYVQEGASDGPPVTIDQTIIDPDTKFIVMDAPPVISELAGKIGVYYAICNEFQSQVWRGALLYSGMSTTDNAMMRRGEAPAEATMGYVVVPPGPAEPWQWDEENTITVELYNGELTACSEAECLAGINRCAIRNGAGDWEIIGFQNVTQVSDTQFVLSKLLRGTRGTEHAVSGHVSGAPFLFLSTASVGFWEGGPSILGVPLYYKAPATGAALSDYPHQSLTCRGLTARPFSVSHLEAHVGPRGYNSNWFTSDNSTVTPSSTDNSFNGPTGIFNRFAPGMYVTSTGMVDAANNTTFRVVSVLNSGSKMIVDTTLNNETPDGGQCHFVEGHPKDITIRWKRRSKQAVSLFAPSPVSADETPLQFVVDCREGGILVTPRRSFTTGAEEVVYTREQQLLDGLTASSFTLMIYVYQVSSTAGRSLASIKEVRVS